MPFAAALSTHADTRQALDEVCASALEQLQGVPDLALLFYTPQHRDSTPELAEAAQERLAARCLLGCPGESIVGNDREIERAPALSLWLARWAHAVSLTPFHLVHEETPEGHSLLGWPYELHEATDPTQQLLLVLADGYTFPVDAFLREVNEA